MSKKEEKDRKDKYYPRLEALILDLGEWGVNLSELEREWHIPKSTLHRWKNQIVIKHGFVSVEEAGRNLEAATKANLRIAQQLRATAKSTRDKIAAIKALNETTKTYTEVLEAYGHKSKVAEQLVINDKPKSLKEQIEEFKQEIQKKEE